MGQSSPNTAILDQSIQELPLSEEFKLRSTLLGFNTLREISLSNKKRVFTKKDFSIFWWNELLDFMEEKGLSNYLNR